MKLLIKNGRVLDPDSLLDGIYDVLIKDGKIFQIGKNMKEEADRVVDASNCYVMPGFIDLHVHLREPGFEHKETIKTGMEAAARGGFTTICAMPNTNPVIDSREMVEFVHNKSKEAGLIHVLQIGAVTKGQEGKELADLKEMKEAGAPGISEDGKSVMNTGLYKKAMEAAAELNMPVFAHCEDKELAPQGVMNEGRKSKELDVPGISNAVEDIIVARDILLAKETGAKLHLCHCSTKDSVAMVRLAKEDGIGVTAEVCPHHFTLTDEDILGRNTNYKMNPPLRSREDVDALKCGLRDGIMDAIATDHAPHHAEEKEQPMEKAPFGIVGLETAAALTITELVDTGYITPMQMAQYLSGNPAKILGIDKGSLKEGKAADVVIIDPLSEYEIDANKFASKGKNTPFHGKKVKGKIIMTVADGTIVFEENISWKQGDK